MCKFATLLTAKTAMQIEKQTESTGIPNIKRKVFLKYYSENIIFEVINDYSLKPAVLK